MPVLAEVAGAVLVVVSAVNLDVQYRRLRPRGLRARLIATAPAGLVVRSPLLCIACGVALLTNYPWPAVAAQCAIIAWEGVVQLAGLVRRHRASHAA